MQTFSQDFPEVLTHYVLSVFLLRLHYAPNTA